MKRLQTILLMLAIAGVANAQEAAQSVSKFSVDFFKQTSAKDNGNTVFSAFSISPTVGMIALGARSQTEQQISRVFHFDSNNPNFHRQVGELQEQIGHASSTSTQISITNRVWIEKQYRLSGKYKKTLKKQYSTKMQSIDFMNAPEPSRAKINATIESDTKNYIKDLLPKGSIDNLTRLVLTNAVYFKGKWDINIDPDNTVDKDFTLSDDRIIQCPTMYVNDHFNTFESNSFKALQMNYKDKKLSMIIILPNEDIKMSDFIDKFDYQQYISIAEGLSDNGKIKVYLPKFKIESSFELKEILCNMGMDIAFSNNADFSGMSSKNDLKISNIYHKAFIEVSEEGTTAAAATGGVMVMKSAFSPQNLFIVNRPFIYILQDNATKTILFMGKVEKPE